MKGAFKTDNFDFTPKSLDDLDNEFFENVRSLNSGDEAPANDFSLPEDLGVKISKQEQQSAPEVPAQSAQPRKPAAEPEKKAENSRAVPPRFSPPAADGVQGRESLLPKQMLYKAAPMQAPLNGDEQSPYVMPKDYALYGKDAMRINTPPEEPEQAKEERKPAGKAKKHTGVIAVSAVLLVAAVLLSAFTGLLKYYSDNTMRLIGGKSVLVVEKSTKSPYLSRGDAVFVTPVKPDELKEDSVAAFLVKEKGYFAFGIITEIKEDDSGKKTAVIKSVNTKSEIMQSTVRAELILGTADDYLPKAGYLVNLLNSYTVVCLCAAGGVILLLVIILIMASGKGKKAKQNDKSGGI